MLDLKKISIQFDEKLPMIKSYDVQRSELSQEYRAELEKMKIINPVLNKKLPSYSGAKFLEPGNLIHPFQFDWKNRMDAMNWVDSVLSDVPATSISLMSWTQ